MLSLQKPKLRQEHVLVVEDEVLIRALVAEELRDAGLCVIEASNADDAWSYAAAGGPVDLLFSDIQMPGSMSGLDLARKLKRRSPRLDVIIASGQATPSDVADVGALLVKPYSPGRAVDAVLSALRSKGPTAS